MKRRQGPVERPLRIGIREAAIEFQRAIPAPSFLEGPDLLSPFRLWQGSGAQGDGAHGVGE